MLTLGIETSCDETAVAVLEDEKKILANEIASQNAAHARFGGIVPELAARIHAEIINHILDSALKEAGVRHGQIDLIAVTVGPGLAVSLVVGISCARALGAVLKVPVQGVNHLEAHLMSNFLSDPEPELPAICLLVSGGHTELILASEPGRYQVLGRTRDDAAGEAFDKVARVLGLGYPGGPAIQTAAGDTMGPGADLPRPMLHGGDLDFSFSGLKTAVINHIKIVERDGGEINPGKVAKGFQDAVIDVLAAKTMRAATESGVRTVMLCGGVAANRPLRERLARECEKNGFTFFSPPLELCTDNACMVAKTGFFNHSINSTKLSLSPQPNISI